MLRKIGSLLALSYFAVAAAYGAYVYVELPAPYKPEDIKRGAKNADAREAARGVVINAIREKGNLDLSYVGVLTYEGVPITPDADEYMKERSRSTEEGTDGEVTYVRGFGWTDNEWYDAADHIYNVHGGGAYAWLKTFYGSPFFNITVSVNYNPLILGGLYIAALDEIHLGGWGGPNADNWKGVLTHEMAHSFRDDWTINWDHFEEGMVEAVTSAVQNVFYLEEPGYRPLWHDSRSETYARTYYEYFFNHNMPGLSCHLQDFSASFSPYFTYYRYGVAGMAWWKVYLQERFFLREFNAHYLWWRMYYGVPGFSILMYLALVAYGGGPIGGLDFVEWLYAQPIFNNDPPLGDDMLLLVKDSAAGQVMIEAYLFERAEEGGVNVENPLAGESVGFEISVEPYPDITYRVLNANENGRIELIHDTSYTEWTDHRVRVAATEPKRPLSRVEFAYVNHNEFFPWAQAEVYGVTTGALSGTVTLTPIDSPGDPAVVPLRNGGFLFSKFPDYPDGRESGDGRFLVSFEDAFGSVTSKIVNKDAAEYFVVLNDLDDDTDGAAAPEKSLDAPPDTALRFFLSQNYPNPCVGLTNFSFVLPSASEPEIAIFDLAGRKLLAVKPGLMDAGAQSLQVDVSPLPPGVYVFNLKAGGESATRKFVIAR